MPLSNRPKSLGHIDKGILVMINDQYTLVMVIFLLLKVDQNDQLNLVIMHDQLELVGLTKSRMTVYEGINSFLSLIQDR